MRKTLRSALIWFLMLALPAQAMAALGMQLCEQVHRSSAMQAVANGHGAHQRMAADDGRMGHHAMPVADTADGGLCTLCAFCVGVAAPSRPFADDSPLKAAEPAPAWPERPVAAIADTPERPPRILLA